VCPVSSDAMHIEVDTTDSDLQPVVIVLLLLGIKTVIFCFTKHWAGNFCWIMV